MTSLAETSTRAGSRVPPHSTDAEESVLGAILLSSDAANQVMDKLHADDFYVPAHQAIFEAITGLYNGNQAIDAITLAESLRRSGELERIGGVPYLTGLINAVPAASNVEWYASIVEEHALRRNLMRAGALVNDVALQVDWDITEVLDRAEQTVLSVAERRVGQGMLPVGPMFAEALEQIEMLEAHGSEVTGISTGFRDLDKKLAGLQKANLVIIAARPSMGKSCLATNVATNVAQAGNSVAVFSLEMSKEEVVQRILCSVGRVDSMKLRTGQLGPLWPKVVDAASRMYRAPIFVDDSAVVTVTDIRAKCRRLKRQHGLSLVVVDYIQLMQGMTRENRQQEISEISRGLKNLARELEVPILAVSQLNRSLETREDKRPRLADLRECLTGDTPIRCSDTGATVTIGELARRGSKDVPVWSLDLDTWRLVPSVMSEVWSTGIKPVFRLTTGSGRVLRSTANHPLLTFGGWRSLGELKVGDRIAVPRRLPEPAQVRPMDEDELVLLAHMIGDGSYVARQPIRYTSSDRSNHAVVSIAANRRFGIRPAVSFLHDNSWQTRLPTPYYLTHGKRNPINVWLDDLGISSQRSPEKRLPQRIFSCPDEQLRLFLHHLWSTDGSVFLRGGRRCVVSYATTSRGLADDLVGVLLRLDFQPRLKRVTKPSYRPWWRVDIEGVDQQRRFLTEIGCHGDRGMAVPTILDALRGVRANTNVDTVPVEVLATVEEAMAAREISRGELRATLGSWQLQRRAPRRERVSVIAEYLGDSGLKALAQSDVLWDEVRSIVLDGEEEVFDARVPGAHNFLVADTIVHNSGALEQDSDVVMFIYRHEYYHPEDQEKKGMAEVHIAKHRAGATGLVEMTFLPEFTRFADLGRDLA